MRKLKIGTIISPDFNKDRTTLEYQIIKIHERQVEAKLIKNTNIWASNKLVNEIYVYDKELLESFNGWRIVSQPVVQYNKYWAKLNE